jgi:hypothetical protein
MVNACTLCKAETDRSGHPYDSLCGGCDYCRRYGHVDETDCPRCGFPHYRPQLRLFTEAPK